MVDQMVTSSLSDERVKAAFAAVESADATHPEKVEMLMEIAMSLQQKPKSAQDLHHAVSLYRKAISLCPAESLLLARVEARMGTALNAIPHDGPEFLRQAHTAFELAIIILKQHGSMQELAEAEMNLGLTIQSLASYGCAHITDAINAYLRSLRIFTRDAYPAEFAILHNNLATAYLSMTITEQNGKMREALAVQSFEEALRVVTLIDYPTEYAMLQNNLGNALQYSSSSHVVENIFRALEAYDEALKVRNPKDTPLEYANTISNKANALRSLPDDPQYPERSNRGNLRRAYAYYHEAITIFQQFGESTKVLMTSEVMADIDQELQDAEDFSPSDSIYRTTM
ncbi:hypothetical protein [Candidatus Nitrospira salsa]|nr:MAG: hypothetical protein NPIRA01_38720 [Nitrospirales bacterium]